MTEPQFPHIQITEAGVPLVNNTYAYDGLSNYRPKYTAPGYPHALLMWGANQWKLAISGQPDYYRTTVNTDWSYEFFQATWELGPHEDTTLPLPVLKPSFGPDLPAATTLLTEGELAPAHIVDPTPTFAWNYIPANGGPPQDAYQIQVASSHLLLDAHLPDLWDSGIVESAEHHATYAGATLGDLQMYFWAVRVRDTAGFWSEDW